MSPIVMLLAVSAVAAALIGGGAFAQTPTDDKSKMDQATQKMKVSEDPSSPEMQQAAAKQASCRKEAKAQKLTGAARKTHQQARLLSAHGDERVVPAQLRVGLSHRLNQVALVITGHQMGDHLGVLSRR